MRASHLPTNHTSVWANKMSKWIGPFKRPYLYHISYIPGHIKYGHVTRLYLQNTLMNLSVITKAQFLHHMHAGTIFFDIYALLHPRKILKGRIWTILYGRICDVIRTFSSDKTSSKSSNSSCEQLHMNLRKRNSDSVLFTIQDYDRAHLAWIHKCREISFLDWSWKIFNRIFKSESWTTWELRSYVCNMGGNFWRYRQRTERFEINGWSHKIRSYKDSLSCATFPIALWFQEDLKRLSIDSTEQNKRLDEIENSMNETTEVFEAIDNEFKDLKRTDDLIKEDLVRKSYAKSSSI